ncbi:MAG: FAD-dependent tricarballylate dehydrogenase TcuA [Chloroflexi bacterium]|nr:FAD-dependent tricarballylate dehydrogenase TcuA [Chloroflexota bacterium]
MSKERCDVAVVGGGSAALEAAVAAAQGGARVIVLEKAPLAETGGNARFSHTGFRCVQAGAPELREFFRGLGEAEFATLHLDPYPVEQFRADLGRVTQGKIKPELAEALVGDCNAAAHWTLETGVSWEPSESRRVIDGVCYFDPGFILSPLGGGLGQIRQWTEIACRLDVDIRYDSKVAALLGSERRIEGVRVSAADGDYELEAGAVILCSGGFQASAEKRARYLGRNADLMKVRGSRHDTGEVLMMALELGAAPAGHWQGAHASPIDATFPDVESSNKANRYNYPFGITVNTLGQRFFDEGEAEFTHTYAKTGWTVLAEPGGLAYQIFDAKVEGLVKDQYYVHGTPIAAGSLAELAEKLGIKPLLIERTVEDFNAAVREDVPFDPTKRDGKGTDGIEPVKSNWAQKIDQPPFFAYPVTGGITFTFGGLAINPDAQVLNGGGRPIEGLYASGDVVGLFFHNYPAGSGQTRNLVFSLRAGRHATQ